MTVARAFPSRSVFPSCPTRSDPLVNAVAADGEIAFWRGFIVWWSREKEGPVPLRAWEALGYSEAKHKATVTVGDLPTSAENKSRH